MSGGDDPEEGAAKRIAVAGLFLGPLAFAVILGSNPPAGLGQAGWTVAAVAALMAIWWLTQAIPIPATGLLPAVLFPLLGVSDAKAAAAPYAHPLVFLFLGGFIVALTIERWNLHRRVAVAVIAFAGVRPDRLIGGFMLATAALSMWVSNTATTLMMVPIALSVVTFVDERGGGTPTPEGDRFARGLLLAVAYAASIGGVATLIGTPPNAFLAGYIEQNHGIEVGFARWMLIGLPVAAVMLAGAWWLLTKVLCRADGLPLADVRAGIQAERAKLGRPGRGEVLTACLFAAVAAAWVLRPLLDDYVPLDDTIIALIGALLAFIVPVSLRDGQFLMNWEHAKRLPWGVLLLFGGGLSLAGAISSTGLAKWLGVLLSDGGALPMAVLLVMVTALVVFLTELTSNTATAAVFIPVAATVAIALGAAPMVFAVPVTLAASCAFMMPVATPPNAIVFGAGRLSVLDMCTAGFLLNILATVVISVAALYLVPLVFPAG